MLSSICAPNREGQKVLRAKRNEGRILRTRIRGLNPRTEVTSRGSTGVSPASSAFLFTSCRRDAGSPKRFVGSLHFQRSDAHWDDKPSSAAVTGCEFRRRLAARMIAERDTRRTRRRDACATTRFMRRRAASGLLFPKWVVVGTAVVVVLGFVLVPRPRPSRLPFRIPQFAFLPPLVFVPADRVLYMCSNE